MPRYKLTIAYDGTDFCGWQKQFPHADAVPSALAMGAAPADMQFDDDGPLPLPPPPGTLLHPPGPLLEPTEERPDLAAPHSPARPRVELRTVQSVVEYAARQVIRSPIVLIGASRTDAGVHARGQVAAFTCSADGGRTGGWPPERGLEPLNRAINSRLPADVVITNVELADDNFDPIHGAVRKAYSYTISNTPQRPLWNRRTAMHVYQPLDVDAMNAAAPRLVGEHDFAAFAAAGHGRKTTTRTVFSCSVRRSQSDPHAIVIDICGSGFLWNMVRIIGGTLVEIGKGRMPAERIDEAIATGDRRKAGPTLPPTGLCLEWIQYA